ncbi:MAG: glyoxalase superfamily protein [Actinomycetota bacterium]
MTDFRLELVNVPVSDVDRAKAFYADQVGFTVDHDHTVTDDLRFVQLTPLGSACSISIGTGLTESSPGSVAGLQLVVDDIEVARAELVGRGVDASEVQVFPWGSFVFFSDPDGNAWSVQQLPDRT